MTRIEHRSEQCPGCGSLREVDVVLVEEDQDYDAIEASVTWTAPCPNPECPTNLSR